MTSLIKRIPRMSRIASNRVVYLSLLVAVSLFAFTSGERLIYIASLVLVIMPVVSYIITFIMVLALNIRQTLPTTIVKEQTGKLLVRLHNKFPLPFANVECRFFYNEYAIEIDTDYGLYIGPMEAVTYEVPFYAIYRGTYQFGLSEIVATDLMGLFRLSHKLKQTETLLVLPRIIELKSIPFKIDIVAEASSRFDHRDEDYSVISDIRPYIPTDSIKRVHWKLTAKRNEWLVKVFQSNALNCVTILLDSQAAQVSEEERYYLEDQITENALAFARYCLKKSMAVEFVDTEGNKTRSPSLNNFNIIYNSTATLEFKDNPPLSPASILTNMLNDSTSYVNSIVFTTRLDVDLYERIVNALNKGHFTAVVYFATDTPYREYERIYKLMQDNGLPCLRISEEVSLDVA